ncbi:MAG: hypothetical protein RLP15_11905 [Cryomorphaceae bacterium]
MKKPRNNPRLSLLRGLDYLRELTTFGSNQRHAFGVVEPNTFRIRNEKASE